MKCAKLQLATKTLLNPSAPQWHKPPVENVRLAGMPLHVQPSAYIRTAWAGRRIGAVRFLKAQAAHNGRFIFFRLQWDDETHNPGYADGSVFPDAAAVIFPSNGPAPLATMGDAEAPVDIWYWRADLEVGYGQNLLSSGLGTEEELQGRWLQAGARWQDGAWSVVVGRPLPAPTPEVVSLIPGGTAQVAFAVWEGSNQERAGLHSYSRDWRPIEIE